MSSVGVETNSWSCNVGLHLLEALSAPREPRAHNADPEAFAARRWINRRLAWEYHLAALHARAGIPRHGESPCH
jgi:hypothetical protein